MLDYVIIDLSDELQFNSKDLSSSIVTCMFKLGFVSFELSMHDEMGFLSKNQEKSMRVTINDGNG